MTGGAAFGQRAMRQMLRVHSSTTEEVAGTLAGEGYLATVRSPRSCISPPSRQPPLPEGEAGVGKTEVARTLASARGARLIRLQCHEGIDLHHAVYDWHYQRQPLAIRAAQAALELRDVGPRVPRRRPLLEALESEADETVLPIDEVDRADDEFEALLLEYLSDSAITIPELGTVDAPRCGRSWR